MIKKKLSLLLLALTLVFTLIFGVACKQAKVPTKPKATKPVSGGTLVLSLNTEPVILNPLIVDGDLEETGIVAGIILPRLFNITPDLKYEPSLLEETPTKENGGLKDSPFTITYKIKKDANWSDGKPITSEDIKYTWQTIMNKKWNILSPTGYDLIKSIDTADPKTAVVSFNGPYAPWKDLFSDVLPKHALEGKDFNKVWNTGVTVSGGPFVFKQWKSGDQIVVERNNNYWGKKAYLDKLVFKFVEDPTTQLAQLKTGELDLISPNADVDLLTQLKSVENTTVKTKPGTRWEQLGFNTTKAPINDVNVRKAIAYSIDRDSIVKNLMKGTATVLQSINVPEQGKFFTPSWKKYKFSPSKAKTILKEAGYKEGADKMFEKDGKPLELTISTTSGRPLREKMVQIIQAQLKDIGIKVNIKNSDTDAFFGWLTDGTFEMAEWGWSASPDPSYTAIFSGNQLPPDGQNYYRYDNKEVTDLLDEQDKEVDENKRADSVKEIQEKMAEDLPLIPFFQQFALAAYNNKVHGPVPNPTLQGITWNAETWWLEK
jgi:peptide/nickel transport system substrate-binding protein